MYEDIEAGHDYLVNVFGFESGGVERTPDGTVVHAEVRTRNGPIWLHRETDGLKAPRNLPAQHGGLSVFVDDVDEHFARVKAAGTLVDASPRTRSTAYATAACAIPRVTTGGSRRSCADRHVHYVSTSGSRARSWRTAPSQYTRGAFCRSAACIGARALAGSSRGCRPASRMS